jgi:NitT/TauT family transport system permease protein
MRMRALLALPGVPPLASMTFLFLLWQAASVALGQSAFPPATQALRALPGLFQDPETYTNLGASLWRMAAGFILALALAVPVGVVMGRSRRVAGFLSPILTAVYPIPKAALMPIIMLWVGIGDLSKVLVIFLGVSLPLVYHSYEGARAVDEKLIWSAMAMGTGPVQRVLRVILPAALPDVLLGCRTGLAMALILMITSEMIVRQSGAGNILFNSLDMAQYDNVYAMIVVLGALGVILDLMFEQVRRRLTFWADSKVEPLPAA